jgi:hypothetical protein
MATLVMRVTSDPFKVAIGGLTLYKPEKRRAQDACLIVVSCTSGTETFEMLTYELLLTGAAVLVKVAS